MNGDREQSFNQTVTLADSQPYITVILRNIAKNGSTPARYEYVHDFWNFKLVQV